MLISNRHLTPGQPALTGFMLISKCAASSMLSQDATQHSMHRLHPAMTAGAHLEFSKFQLNLRGLARAVAAGEGAGPPGGPATHLIQTVQLRTCPQSSFL